MINDENTSWEQIASKLHHEMNKKELAEFDRLLLTEKHLNEFNSVKQINERLTEVGYISAGQGDQSWKKIERTIKIRRFKKLNAMLKYAAIIILAFGTGLVFRPSSKIEKIETDIRYSEIRVPFGQMSQVVLSDGTKIWLNSGTTIRYPEQFAADSRSVTINGEAYFEVAKMAHKPFTVNSSDLKIEVLGTSFNISAYQEDQESAVTLVEGKVNAQSLDGKSMINLIPGQLATKNKNNSNIAIKEVDTNFYKAWIEGRIFFDDEPLGQIANKLDRWFNVKITFDNEKLKSHRFTGTILKNKPVDQIMQALELLAPIKFKHEINATGKDRIIIYSKS